MTRHLVTIAAFTAAGFCAVVIGFGLMLGRIDRARLAGNHARTEAKASRVELDNVRADLRELAARDGDALEVCRSRTDHLRRILEIMIPSGVWPDRVQLPDPPPGWKPWPIGNRYGLSPD